MHCNNCNTKINSTDKFCQNCGKCIEINKPTKKNIATKISQTMLIIVTIIAIIVLLTLLFYIVKNPMEGLFFIVIAFYGIIGIGVGIGYYLTLFNVSKSIDRKQKKSKLYNMLIIFFNFLPILVFLIYSIFVEININKKTYTFNNISITFPEDFFKSTTSNSLPGLKYKYVGFAKNSDNGNNQCIIGFEMNDYDKSYVEYFNERFAYRFGVDPYLNDLSDMKSININEKEWKFYEIIKEDKSYKMYSIQIDDYIYLIDIEDRKISDPMCAESIQGILKTIKYKK